MNNVATSRAAITKLCPALIAYFAVGVRPSMLDLAMLHEAARAERVFLRGPRGERGPALLADFPSPAL